MTIEQEKLEGQIREVFSLGKVIGHYRLEIKRLRELGRNDTADMLDNGRRKLEAKARTKIEEIIENN